MLFSRNDRADWDFADQAAKAYVDWLHHSGSADYEANIQRDEALGRLSLFEDPAPDCDDLEERLRIEAESYLTTHLADVVRVAGGVRPIDRLGEVYGDMLGRARATHVRSALEILYAEGKTSEYAKGEFWMRTIRWAGQQSGATGGSFSA